MALPSCCGKFIYVRWNANGISEKNLRNISALAATYQQ